jgi:ABC-type bacteriocin/lantibiotic exporter with double-glycine peptidase domain
VHALIGFGVTIQEALVGLERFYRVYDLPDETREFAHGEASTRALTDADLDRVRFRDVEVDHGAARIRIACDLHMERGKHYLWHGPNGAGKTSLGLAFAGLVPHRRGTILAGDAPLCDFALPSVREHVLYVGHEPYWPERTLGENFSNVDGDGVLEHARLQAALDLAEATDILDSLPLGMRTTLTGKELSAGENQRLFLAMALYRRPRVLLLDEALANVGAPVVQRIVRRLVQLGPETQVIFVSHSAAYLDLFQGELRFPARVR